MAVLADSYIPSQPGGITRAFDAGRDARASLMERKQRLAMAQENQRMAQEQNDQQRMEFIAKLPAIQAKAQADAITAKASIENATRMENLRAKASADSVSYNDEFLRINQLENAGDRQAGLAALQAKVAWMKNPGLKGEFDGFVDLVNNERASAFTMDVTNSKLEQATENIRIKTASQEQMQQENAILRKQLTEMNNAASQNRVLTQQEGANQRTNTVVQGANDRNDASNATRDPATRVKNLMEQANLAEQEGETALATALRARLAKEVAPAAGRGTSRRELPAAVSAKLGIPSAPAPSASPTQQAVQKPVKGTRVIQNGVTYQFDGTTWKADKAK